MIHFISTRILNSTIYEAQENFVGFPSYWGFNYLLCILQVLHIIWTCMIFRMLFKLLFYGISEDERESSEKGDEHEHKE